MNNKPLKRVTSFLMACAMSFSTLVTNAESVFADSGGKATATLINDAEHGTLTFAENNFEDVYVDVPLSELEDETNGYSFTVNEDGEVEMSEAVDIESKPSSEETSEENTEESTEKSTEDSTEKSAEESTEKPTEESIEYTQVVDPNSKLINAGDLVTINAEPEEGYSVDTVYVLTDSGKSIVYDFDNNKISFNMPKNDVTIRATFTTEVSDIKVDDSVKTLATYIKSNIDTSYVNIKQWTPVDIIRVKSLLLDKDVLAENNLTGTLAEFNTLDEAAMSLVHFTEMVELIYDVDPESDYYIAFVNTLINDDTTITDYCYAKNNDNGEEIDKYHFDANTGIMYIPKDTVNYYDEESDSYKLYDTQFQIVSTINTDNNHKINLTVNDDNNIVDLESGIINTSIYDNYVVLSLSNSDELLESIRNSNIIVNINGIDIDAKNNTGVVLFRPEDCSIIIYGYVVNFHDISITVTNNDVNIDENIANAASSYSNYGALTSTNAANWKFKSGSASANKNSKLAFTAVTDSARTDDSGIRWTYATGASYSYDPYSDMSKYSNGYYIDENGNRYIYSDGGRTRLQYNPSFVDEASVIVSGERINDKTFKDPLTEETVSRDIKIDGQNVTFTASLGANQTVTLDDGSEWNINASNAINSYGLNCTHVGWPGNPHDPTKNLDIKKKIFLRVLKVDTTNHLVTWGLVIKAWPGPMNQNGSGGQAGVGVFVSSYTEDSGNFKLNKAFQCVGLASGLPDMYSRAGTVYKLKQGDKVYATFTADNASNTINNENWTVSVASGLTGKNGTEPTVSGLKPGNYTLEETAANGWTTSKTQTITIEAGKTATPAANNNDGRKRLIDYPVFTNLSVKKYGRNTLSNLTDTTFELYYSQSAFDLSKCNAVVSNDHGSATYTLVNTNGNGVSASESNKANYVVKIATLKTDSNGNVTSFTRGIKLYESSGHDIISPSIDSDGNIIYLPLGHYMLVETKAAKGYSLDLKNNKPKMYYMVATGGFNSPTYDPDSNDNKFYTLNAAGSGTGKAMNSNFYDGTTGPAANTTRYELTYDKQYKIDTVLTNKDYTFKVSNTSLEYSAKKHYSYNAYPNNLYYIPNEKWDTFRAEFLTGRVNAYSLENATYVLSIYNNDTQSYQQIATGKTDNTGMVIWTVNSIGSSIYGLVSTGNTISGFRKGNKVRLQEIVSSKGTIRDSAYQIDTFDTSSIYNVTTGNARNNVVRPASITVNKIVNLKKGNDVSSGSYIEYVNSKNEFARIKIEKDTTINDKFITDNDVNIAKNITLDFSDACEADRQTYFKNVSFDIWYDPTATSVNNANFPSYSVNADKTSASVSTNYNGSAVKVASVEYRIVDGKTKLVITPKAFNVNTANNVTYSGVEVDGVLRYMPIGAYAVYETKCPESSEINNKPEKEYITNSYRTTVDFYNNASTTNPTIRLKKTPAENAKTVQDLDGAYYDIYYMTPEDAEKIKLSGSKTLKSLTSFDSINDLNADEYNAFMANVGTFNYKFKPTDNIHLVGEFRVSSSDSKNPENAGIVVSNLFASKTFMYYDTKTTKDGKTTEKSTLYNVNSTNSSNDLAIAQQIKASYEYLSNAGLLNTSYGGTFMPASMFNTTTKDTGSVIYAKRLIELDTTLNFIGPNGFYVVVERLTPNTGSYALDNNIYAIYQEATMSKPDKDEITITSREPIKTDMPDLELVKVDADNLTVNPDYSLGGTIYTAQYYDATNYPSLYNTSTYGFFKTTYDNTQKQYGNEYTNDETAPLIYNYVVPGTGQNKNKVRTAYAGFVKEWNEDAAKNIAMYRNMFPRLANITNGWLNKMNVPAGILILSETKSADGFNTTGEFTNSDNKSFGQYLIIKLEEVADSTDLNIYMLSTNGTWIPYNNDISSFNYTMKFYRDNHAEPFNLEFNKYIAYVDNNNNVRVTVPSATDAINFELVMYDQNGKTEIQRWPFTVSSNSFNSLNNSAFNTCKSPAMAGKPLVPTYVYEIREVKSNNSYKAVNTFTYTSGMTAAEMFGQSIESKYVYNYGSPKILTEAWTGNHVKYADANSTTAIEITDTVSLFGLAPGNTYCVRGILVDVTNPNNPVYLKDNAGNYITSYATVDAISASRLSINTTVDVKFNIPAGLNLQGKTINVYEYLGYVKPIMKDGKSTAIYDYGYSATDNNYKYVDGSVTDNNHMLTVTNNKVNTAGIGLILDKSTPVSAQNKVYIAHTDSKDEKQNIHFPKITTSESDIYTSSHVSGLHSVFYNGLLLDDNIIYVQDKVNIDNIPNGNYKLVVSVKDFDTNKLLVSDEQYIDVNDANEITNIVHDTGVLTVIGYTSNKFYITEELYDNNTNVKVASHTDKNVVSQQGYVPSVGTQAFSAEFNKKLVPATKDASIYDVVNYNNLLNIEHTYYLHGYLVDKETNKIVSTAEKSFSSKTKSGSTTVDFKFDASDLGGSTLVVYEYLYFDKVTNTLKTGDTFSDDTIMKADANPNHTNYGKLLAKHYDANDAKQIVYVPGVKTNAIATNNTSSDNNKLIVPKSKETTIIDKIDLISVMNDNYSAFGFLVDLTDHKIVARGSNTNIVVNSATEPSNAVANVEFKFDASKYVNHKLVVYEYVYYGKQTNVTIGSSLTVGTKFDESKIETSTPDGYMVGKHVSDTDKSQIVKVLPMVDFLKVDNVTGETLAGAEYRIVNPDTKVQEDRWITTKNAHSVALAPGHYILEELSAPDGHALNDPVEFDVAIDENETLKVTYTIGGAEPRYTTKTTNYDNGTTETYKQYEIRSNDVRLSNLPTAGGFGTHPFTYVGIMMFAVAAFVLYRRKKDTNV